VARFWVKRTHKQTGRHGLKAQSVQGATSA
jgi:hypothetical protein